MGKLTGKKRKLNRWPILYIGAAGLAVIVIFTILVWPKPPVELKFTEEPAFSPHLSKAGTFKVRWQVNTPVRATLHYRFAGSQSFDELSTQLGERGAAAVPAQAGTTIEFYVDAPGPRNQPLRSKDYQVTLLPYVEPPATKPAK